MYSYITRHDPPKGHTHTHTPNNRTLNARTEHKHAEVSNIRLPVIFKVAPDILTKDRQILVELITIKLAFQETFH